MYNVYITFGKRYARMTLYFVLFIVISPEKSWSCLRFNCICICI